MELCFKKEYMLYIISQMYATVIIENFNKYEVITDHHAQISFKIILNVSDLSIEEYNKLIQKYSKHRYFNKLEFTYKLSKEELENKIKFTPVVDYYKNFSKFNHFASWEIYEEGYKPYKREPKIKD